MEDTRYAVRYSEEAAAKRDNLAAPQRKAFDRAITILAEQPRHEKSLAMGENVRHIRLTNDILAEYAIFSQFVMILVLNIFDRQDVLVADED
ncbi:type II toxin-antitoxin system RelE family toxin [Streptomyces nondiastaticus]|uniref:Type II toxin-antitoxin system RelE/ParE family toxin n=1 Tax=Streptomyces nondiastaticus TaxID=3154512 RepID=A0ABW6U0W1_9ACTN